MSAGMHGYHPDERDCNAALLSSETIPSDILQIQQILGLMTASAGLR